MVVMCGSGYRSALAMLTLQLAGFSDVRNLDGGLSSLQFEQAVSVAIEPELDAQLKALPADWGVVTADQVATLDALISARSVGPSGRVIGVDMTSEMVTRANANASAAGVDHVEFREGRLESLPVADTTVDAVTSNCVINLVPDKAAVFGEIARVLRPGGRLVVSDVVLDGELPETISTDVLAYVGCVAGAVQRDRYFEMLAEAGLIDLEILKDVDFLEAMGGALPAELIDVAAATGVTPEDVKGLVRSITYRAWKE